MTFIDKHEGVFISNKTENPVSASKTTREFTQFEKIPKFDMTLK